jgi:hypothetical protein
VFKSIQIQFTINTLNHMKTHFAIIAAALAIAPAHAASFKESLNESSD